MAAYSSTQSGNFNNPATWGGSGWPNLDGDTFTVNAGHTITYNLTTPLHGGLGSGVVNAGGTFIMDTNTVIRFNAASTWHFNCNGNYIARPGSKTLLKGTTTSNRVFDIRPLSFQPTTVTGVSGQNTVTVASNVSQIIVGNKVAATGIAADARVTAINGNILTLSANNTGTVSGTLTVGNYVEIIGSEPMPITTVSSAITTAEHQQGFIDVDNASQFSIGDWIAVYKRGYSDARLDRNDEGFLIHDISSNRIFIREFVGPSTTIQAVNGNIITVGNSKLFRTWQKLIFGTGVNRNIHSITSIDYVTNTITLSDSVTGSVVNEVIYTTGPLQKKNVGDKVRKIATTVLTQAASNANQITLTDISGFQIGDEVLIDALWHPTATSYTDEFPEKRNITNIVGNTITLNQSLGYIAFAGAFVTKLNKDIKYIGDYETTLTLSSPQTFAVGDVITQAVSNAKGIVKTATTNSTTVLIQDIFGQFQTGSSSGQWVSRNGTPLGSGNVSISTISVSTSQGHSGFSLGRAGAHTSNQLPVLYFRNVEVAHFSDADTTSSRFFIRGSWSTHENINGGAEFEGITFMKPNQTDNFNYQDNSIFFNRYVQDATLRCSVAWNTVNGIWTNEGYELRNLGVYNNISSRSENVGLLISNLDRADTGFGITGGAWEFSHNYIHRSDDNGIQLDVCRSAGRGIHHNWVNVSQARSLLIERTYSQAVMYQNRFQSYFEPVFALGSNEHNLIYNEWIPGNNFNDFTIDAGSQRNNYSVSFSSSVVSLEHNYFIDGVTVFFPGTMRVWDNTEQAWRCYFDDDIGTLDYGYSEVYYIPANATLKAKGTIKLVSDFGTIAPKLEIRGAIDRVYAGTEGSFSGDQPFRGFTVSADFNASNKSTYQSVEVTFPPKPWGRCVTVGIINKSSTSNSWRGWWEKPIEVKLDILPDTPFLQTGYNKFSGIIGSGTDFTQQNIRIGGRLN